MSQWNDEKAKVKDIFDCIRNFALCGLVFYVGIQCFLKPVNSYFLMSIYYLTGISMLLLSIYLFYINFSLFNKTVRKEHEAGNIGNSFYFLIPMLVIMLAINLLVQTALSIPVSDGKTLGELTIQDLERTNADSTQKQP
ncbi:hypothetical protein [Rheinheimera baltica]|uniref:hypothetical protein n=1 Tax=Rheinheimera baltica TaxID=67576 RepID=UPI00273E288F|nr:hypothetical protein [Rheinheimera baltica]MDP5191180.1 hypothetical protein [Rheinheimera baltica]